MDCIASTSSSSWITNSFSSVECVDENKVVWPSYGREESVLISKVS